MLSAVTFSVGGDVAHRALPFSAFCNTDFVMRFGLHVPDAFNADGRMAHTPTISMRYRISIPAYVYLCSVEVHGSFTSVLSVAKK